MRFIIGVVCGETVVNHIVVEAETEEEALVLPRKWLQQGIFQEHNATDVVVMPTEFEGDTASTYQIGEYCIEGKHYHRGYYCVLDADDNVIDFVSRPEIDEPTAFGECFQVAVPVLHDEVVVGDDGRRFIGCRYDRKSKGFVDPFTAMEERIVRRVADEMRGLLAELLAAKELTVK